MDSDIYTNVIVNRHWKYGGVQLKRLLFEPAEANSCVLKRVSISEAVDCTPVGKIPQSSRKHHRNPLSHETRALIIKGLVEEQSAVTRSSWLTIPSCVPFS